MTELETNAVARFDDALSVYKQLSHFAQCGSQDDPGTRNHNDGGATGNPALELQVRHRVAATASTHALTAGLSRRTEQTFRSSMWIHDTHCLPLPHGTKPNRTVWQAAEARLRGAPYQPNSQSHQASAHTLGPF